MPPQDENQSLIIIYQRRLKILKGQQVYYGPAVPPHIVMEIEDIQAELTKLGIEPDVQPPPTLSVASPPRRQVFISYSRRDLKFVQKLAVDLERAGFAPWWDLSNIPGGEMWGKTIEENLRQSHYCLVILSPDSVKSTWVRREIVFAEKRGIPIIPLLRRDCGKDELIELAHLEYIDFCRGPYKQAWQRLLWRLIPPEKQPVLATPLAQPAQPARFKQKLLVLAHDPLWQTIGVIVAVLALAWVVYTFYMSLPPSPTIPPQMVTIATVTPASTGIGGNLSLPTSDSTIMTPNPASTATPRVLPTPIAKGKFISEVNFVSTGDGNCDNYDLNLLGYENKQYYIQPPRNGYIAICNNGSKPPQGSLEVTAYPSKASSVFGYGVVFGWAGSKSTTDACIFGLHQYTETRYNKDGHPISTPIVLADFSQYSNGDYKSESKELTSVNLDSNAHTIRVVLQPDGTMAAYLDEHFITDYKFNKCANGKIGMVAWGDNNTKIYFDDLKLFALP